MMVIGYTFMVSYTHYLLDLFNVLFVQGLTMLVLILGLILFLGIHSISIVAEPLRDRAVAISELGWKLFYAAVSLLGLWLIISGYSAARLDPYLIYVSPRWTRHLAALLLLPVFVFALAPYFPGRIKRVLGHPQLVAVKLWALSHLLVNGTLADLILFGSFLAWAVIDRISMKRRQPRPVPGMPESWVNDVILLVVGLALYVVTVLWAHKWLIGVAPFG